MVGDCHGAVLRGRTSKRFNGLTRVAPESAQFVGMEVKEMQTQVVLCMRKR